jgi:hypothetical protein
MSAFRKFHAIAALCGDGLRPELPALFERLAVDPHSELFLRGDGMVQSGPDPIAAEAPFAQNAARPMPQMRTATIILSSANSNRRTWTLRRVRLFEGCWRSRFRRRLRNAQ